MRATVLAAVGWVLLAIFVAIAAFLRDYSTNVTLFQFAYLIGFIGYGLIVYVVWRGDAPGGVGFWLVGSILFRIVLIPSSPSDDLHRYLWEGQVQAAGFNPYKYAPDSPELSELRDANWEQINHKDYPAIYPPLAQIQFLGVALAWPTLGAIKTFYVLFDVAAVLLLAGWLRAMGKPVHLAMVYGLCPLTISAVAIDGHLDSALVAMLAAAGWADARKRYRWCGVFIGLAILTKIIPIFLLPWLARRRLSAAVIAVAVVVAGVIPYFGAGGGLIFSLLKFPREMEMLSLGHGLSSLLADGATARILCAAVIAAVSLWYARKSLPLCDVLLGVLGAFILFMPIVHYWYLVWIVLAVSVRPTACWLVLCASMVFYFEAIRAEAMTGVWEMPRWVTLPVYIPFIVACVIEFRRRRAGPAA